MGILPITMRTKCTKHYLLCTYFCAIFFIGVVTFEVIFLEKIRKHMPVDVMEKVQVIITTRARKNNALCYNHTFFYWYRYG